LSTADGPATDRNIEEAGLLLRFFVARIGASSARKKKPAGMTRRARQE
jgi:hypothetical protein